MMRICTALSLVLAMMLATGDQLFSQVTYTVNTTDDNNDGNCNAAHCSLREAILASNSDGGQASRIEFAIPGPGPQVINLGGTLPNFSDANTTLDGTTQTGQVGGVILDCSGIPAVNDHVIEIQANRTRIFGLEIRNFDVKTGGNVIHLGTPSFAPQLCEIGGVNKGNVIHSVTNGTGGPGNFGSAIYLQRAAYTVIQGNIIGTNLNGDQALPVYNVGIFIEGDASQYELNYIGGSTPGQGNTVVACGGPGIVVMTGDGFVRNNLIGVTDRQGMNRFPNLEGIFSRSEIQIGGPGNADGNFVGYNLTHGIHIEGDVGSYEIESNRCFHNGSAGIAIDTTPNLRVRKNICFGNEIGIWVGAAALDLEFSGNELYDNRVGLYSRLESGTRGHLVTDNSFYCNSDAGIDLELSGYGVLPPPVITSTSPTEIRGTSRPNAVVEVFRENARSCAGAPCQGFSLIGRVTASGAGNWILTGSLGGGYNATATQTDGRDNTSAFSACVPVLTTCTFVVDNTDDSGPGSLRAAIECANSTPGPDVIEFAIPGAGPHVINPLSPLPVLSDDGTTIDGTSQPGNFPMAAGIIIDGSQAGAAGVAGLDIEADDCAIYGLVLQNFSGAAIAAGQSAMVSGLTVGEADAGNILVSNAMGITATLDAGGTFQANYIGTDLAFNAGLGNTDGGVDLRLGSGVNVRFGGDRIFGEGNYVCSNGAFGLSISSVSQGLTASPQVYGNNFGTDAGGTIALPNQTAAPALWVRDMNRGVIIGESGGRYNVVAFHETGIRVETDNNSISHNSFYCNTSRAIDLAGGAGNAGVVAPVIEQATELAITGTSKPLDLIELYISDDSECRGVPCQGKTYVGSVFTDNAGDWSFIAPFALPITNGMTVVVTGTDPRSNTSEFSECRLLCDRYRAEASHAGPFCEGEPIRLIADAPISGTVVEYEWTGPMGYVSSEKEPEDAPRPGVYVLRVRVDGCESDRDTVIVPPYLPNSRGTVTDRLCAYEEVQVGGETFNIDRPFGQVTLEGASANGCDSVVTVNLSFRAGGLNLTRGALCPGDSRVINGVEYNEFNLTGGDTIPGGSFNGCDSVIRVEFTLLEEPQAALTPVLCPGQFVVVNGERYDEQRRQGEERIVGAAANGCDSVVHIFLTYEQEKQGSQELPICPGGSAMYRGELYDESRPSGAVRLPGGAVNGCDSLVNVSVRVLPEPEGELVFRLCPGETVFYNGTSYSVSRPTGQERLPGLASNGCDSLVNVRVELMPEPMGTVRFELCPGETIVYNGTEYSDSRPTGTEIFTGMASNGCDSLVVVQVDVLPEARGSYRPVICENEQLTFNGTIYDASNPTGQERLPGMGGNGCDSLVDVALQFFPEARGQLVQQLCPGQQFEFFGEVFDANRPSGEVVLGGLSSMGCDSIVEVSIDIVTEITEEIREVLCEGDQLLVNGRVYDASNPSGRELLPGGSAQGCDSVIVVDLEFRGLEADLSAEPASCPNTRDGRVLVSRLGEPGGQYRYAVGSGGFVTAPAAPFYIDGLGAGPQQIRFRDEAGCDFNFTIEVPGPAGLNLDLGPNIAGLPGDQITLSPTVLSFSPVTIEWSPARFLSCVDCLMPVVTGLSETQTFTLVLTDENGCEITDQVTVFINADEQIFVPNAFTPNGDGINEVFTVSSNELVDRISRLTVFDRWGVAVYEASNIPAGDPTAGWDGSIGGKPALPGVYAYSVEIQLLGGQVRVLTGDVTLIR